MNNLPKGWASCRVKEVFDSFSGGTPSKSASEYWNGRIPWISSGEFHSQVIRTGSEFITKEGLENSSAKLCRPGSVIVVVRSGILKHTLPVAIVGDSVAINQDIKCFDSLNDDINRWLFLTLRTFAKQILSLNREGTTVQSVKYETLKELELPIPPLNEQRRIVRKLESLLTRVDVAQTRLATIPLILKRFRQSVLNAACSGKLTTDWRENNPSVESGIELVALLSNAHDRAGGHKKGNAAPPTDNVHTLTLDGLPDSWGLTEMRNLVKPSRPITYGILKPGPETLDGIPYVRVADFPNDKLNVSTVRHTTAEIDSAYARARLREGDILLSIRGTVGRVCTIPKQLDKANITQDSARLTIQSGMDAQYVAWLLRSPATQDRMKRAIKGVAVRGINIGDVRALQVPVPPFLEQQEIVRRVEALFTTADALEARYRKAKVHMDKLTQSILAKAFRGELVLQDPNDEPASVLLESIHRKRKVT